VTFQKCVEHTDCSDALIAWHQAPGLYRPD